MDTRSRELRLEDSLHKSEKSAMALAKDNHRLQTAYNEVSDDPMRLIVRVTTPYLLSY